MEQINRTELKEADRLARGCRYAVVTRASKLGGLEALHNRVESSHRTPVAAEQAARRPMGNFLFYYRVPVEVI